MLEKYLVALNVFIAKECKSRPFMYSFFIIIVIVKCKEGAGNNLKTLAQRDLDLLGT